MTERQSMSSGYVSAYSHIASLSGRIVIVTGAARGIGRGIAQALLQRGASVVLVDVLAQQLTDTMTELDAAGLSSSARVLVADLRDPDSAQLIVDTTLEAFGSVHALVNNAVASNEPKPFVDIEGADFDLVYDTGPRATFRLMQAVRPALTATGGGAVVNLGSASGTAGEPNFGAYASAKEAIRGMSKVAALEWGADGIRVNVICPLAETDGTRIFREAAPERYKQVINSIPLKRMGDPLNDVGALVAFLIGDDATFITAQTIFIDGGAGSFR
jgi:NAD(P)-dependent dehydrogenase (short-subunit alcohol dehydrogenase family)